MRKGGLLAIAVAAAVASPAVLGAQQLPGAAPVAEAPQVALGHVLAIQGDCAGCHNRPGGQPFAGGLPLATPFGTIYSVNITPDRETGIGTWTADQFWNAMHNGVRADGAKLYPAFPYPYFTHITRAESDALYAYFRTVPAVSYRAPANKLPFPLNIRPLVAFWNALYFKPDKAPTTGPTTGQHLVQGLGHCGACHTPKTFLGGDEAGHELEGGKLDNWFAPALNADARRGLGAWSDADVAEYLKTGRNARANASASMADVVRYSTSQMADADLSAVAAYLRAQPSHATEPLKANPRPQGHGRRPGDLRRRMRRLPRGRRQGRADLLPAAAGRGGDPIGRSDHGDPLHPLRDPDRGHRCAAHAAFDAELRLETHR